MAEGVLAGWQIGLVITMAVGVAVILFGALWDRERNRRRAEQLTRPPDRSIPGYSGDDPAYVTASTQLPGGDRPLSAEQRSALQVRLRSAAPLPALLAAGEFVSDPESGLAILDQPRVLVCADPVVTLRELLAFLDRAAGSDTAVVIAAPDFDAETRETLIVNHLARSLRIIAITADASTLKDIAGSTGAMPLSRADLMSGWIPEDAIGSAGTWVSSRERTWVLEAPHGP